MKLELELRPEVVGMTKGSKERPASPITRGPQERQRWKASYRTRGGDVRYAYGDTREGARREARRQGGR